MDELIAEDTGLVLKIFQHEKFVLISHFFIDQFTGRSYYNSSLLVCYNEIEQN